MDKKQITTTLVLKACKQLGISFTQPSTNKGVIKLHLKRPHYIINSNFGLINSTDAALCLDKTYQIEVLKDDISLPKSKSYVNPHDPKFGSFAHFTHHQEIQDDILNHFSFPLVAKKNTGSEGENIFKVDNKRELGAVVQTIFDLNSHLYDHVLLIQEYIQAQAEYRAVIYKNKVRLLYKKDITNAKSTGNLSPLHYQGAKAIDIDDTKLEKKIEALSNQIIQKIPLQYYGLDILHTKNDKLILLEINSIPGFQYYLQDNPESKVLKLFTDIISDLQN